MRVPTDEEINKAITDLVEKLTTKVEYERCTIPVTDAVRRILTALDGVSSTSLAHIRQHKHRRRFADVDSFKSYVVEYFKPYIAPLQAELLCEPNDNVDSTLSKQRLEFTIDNAGDLEAFIEVYESLVSSHVCTILA